MPKPLSTSPLTFYYDLELPPGRAKRPSNKKTWPVVIGTHGYQGNKESMMRLVTRITQDDMIAVSLQGPYQFWIGGSAAPDRRVGFGWGTSYGGLTSVELHHHAMNQLIQTLVRDHRADPQRVFLVAFSQSCSFNYRFAFTHAGMVRGTVAVCGGVPSDWKSNDKYIKDASHVMHIAATDDQWYSPERNEKYRQDLPFLAASTDFRIYKSPHRFPRAALLPIRRWIKSKS